MGIGLFIIWILRIYENIVYLAHKFGCQINKINTIDKVKVSK